MARLPLRKQSSLFGRALEISLAAPIFKAGPVPWQVRGEPKRAFLS